MTTTRRSFLRGGVAALAALTAETARSAPTNPTQPIIDAHQHVWDLDRFRLPWLDRAGERLNRTYSVADYAKAAEGLGVVKAVYAEVAVMPRQWEAEAEYVTELCRTRAGLTAAAVFGGDPAADAFPAYIRRFAKSPFVKGVRHAYQKGFVDNPKFLDGIRLLGELGLSFDLQLGPDLLREADRLVAACPQTRFVLDHCGGVDVKWWQTPDEKRAATRRTWEDGVARLADRKNVVCKISGVAESGDDGKVTAATVAPPVNHCLDRFGDGRVLFASNWPVCLRTITYAQWVALLREVVKPRGDVFARKLFHDNAAAFFAL
jgi:predicted TIM-barrel fold metal-dependent hydrolase